MLEPYALRGARTDLRGGLQGNLRALPDTLLLFNKNKTFIVDNKRFFFEEPFISLQNLKNFLINIIYESKNFLN